MLHWKRISAFVGTLALPVLLASTACDRRDAQTQLEDDDAQRMTAETHAAVVKHAEDVMREALVDLSAALPPLELPAERT